MDGTCNFLHGNDRYCSRNCNRWYPVSFILCNLIAHVSHGTWLTWDSSGGAIASTWLVGVAKWLRRNKLYTIRINHISHWKKVIELEYWCCRISSNHMGLWLLQVYLPHLISWILTDWFADLYSHRLKFMSEIRNEDVLIKCEIQKVAYRNIEFWCPSSSYCAVLTPEQVQILNFNFKPLWSNHSTTKVSWNASQCNNHCVFTIC